MNHLKKILRAKPANEWLFEEILQEGKAGQYTIDNQKFEIVESVVRVKEVYCDTYTQPLYYVIKYGSEYFKIKGTYNSWHGYDWSEKWEKVVPKEKTTTIYE